MKGRVAEKRKDSSRDNERGCSESESHLNERLSGREKYKGVDSEGESDTEAGSVPEKKYSQGDQMGARSRKKRSPIKLKKRG